MPSHRAPSIKASATRTLRSRQKKTTQSSPLSLVTLKKDHRSTKISDSTTQAITQLSSTQIAKKDPFDFVKNELQGYIKSTLNSKLHKTFDGLFNNLRDINTQNSLNDILPLLITAFNQSIATKKDAISRENMLSYLKENKEMCKKFIELTSIAITFIVKKSILSDEREPVEFVKDLLAPTSGIDLKSVKSEFDKLQKLSFEAEIERSLERLPGRGISYFFTGSERIKVSKNNFSKKKNATAVEFLQARRSPFDMIFFTDISAWRQLKHTIVCMLNLEIRYKYKNIKSNIEIFNRKHFSSFGYILARALQQNSLLVQDFSPGAAKFLIAKFFNSAKNLNVLDVCGGWGDRLIGALASEQVAHFHINDTNPALTSGYQKIATTLNPENKSVTQTQQKAESDWGEQFSNSRDLVITSPPYFAREHYHGEQASHRSFTSLASWVDGFLAGFAKNISFQIKSNGYACILMNDLAYIENKKTVIYPLVDKARILFEANNMTFIESIPYSSIQHKDKSKNNYFPVKTNSGRVGETFLIFRKPQAMTISPSLSNNSFLNGKTKKATSNEEDSTLPRSSTRAKI